jgi:predicted nuclease with RNAse H fold
MARAFSGVHAVLNEVMGVVGEWGELSAAAIDAPLTWAGTPTGVRHADELLQKRVPDWVPATWFRPPNALPGAVAIQGPALTWAMKVETKLGNLPEHDIYETHPRASLSRTARDLKASILGYRNRDLKDATRRKHIATLVERFVDSGNVALEAPAPTIAEELEALVSALTALGVTYPQSGLVTHVVGGGPIRPVGTRQIAILDALP